MLKEVGIAKMTVSYEGCDGWWKKIYEVLAAGPEPESGPAPEIAIPDVKVTLLFDWKASETLPLNNAIEEMCWEMLEEQCPDWARDAGGGGTFTFDVAAESIQLRHFYSEIEGEW